MNWLQLITGNLVKNMNLTKRTPNAIQWASTSANKKYPYLEVSSRDNMDIIRFNRPEKKNAVSQHMWKDLITILSEVAKNDNAITVLTGTGDYFSSGADLQVPSLDPESMSKLGKEENYTKHVVDAVIDYPKPLIAVVNGHTIGIAFTLLGLCDGVYATEKATFVAPFTQLGLAVEGCSSVTFARSMGQNQAADLLLFGNKITAAEAHRRGLVTRVYPDNVFEREVWSDLARIAALPKGSMRDSKRIMRDIDRKLLHSVNEKEMDLAVQRWQTEEFMQTLLKFNTKKSKL